ncbi:MAG TPA: hypothetical protein VK391_00655 [Allosphingosinicella sp.]|nr:hypothetical protein [Allosphingosinicella sp.]
MNKLLTLALALVGLTAPALAHPPRGIVVDGAGRVYFSDLERIWMIDRRGRLSLVRAGVFGRHIHELVIDAAGAVYGEEQSYDSAREEWPSAIWKLWPDRRVTYIVPETRAPVLGTGLWRDGQGCTYLAQQDRPPAGPLLFRRCAGRGPELLFGNAADAGRYRQVLLSNIGGTAIGPDGSFYFRHGGTVRKRSPAGAVAVVATGLAVENYGIAVGGDGTLYVAEFAARRIVAIAPDGRRRIVATASAPWAPTGLAFRFGSLYVLEAGQRDPRDPIAFRVRKRLPNGALTTVATLPSAE